MNKPTTKYAISYFNNVYGIGKKTGEKVLGILLLNPRASFSILKSRAVRLGEIISLLLKEFDLKLYIFRNMLRKMKHSTRKGINMLLQLPVRGQRTKTNASTPKKQHKMGTYFAFRIKKIVKTISKTQKNKKLVADKKKLKSTAKKKPKKKK